MALHRPDYVRAPKIQKPSVARVIVRAIRNGDPPGRFLRKDEKTGSWYDIGDKKAAEKTSQALREKTDEERERIKREGVAATAVAAAVAGTVIPVASLQQTQHFLSQAMLSTTTHPVMDSKNGKPAEKADASLAAPEVEDDVKIPVVDPVVEAVAAAEKAVEEAAALTSEQMSV